MIAVTVLWFAQLREQRGLDEERVETDAPTLRELWRELSRRHGLAFPERSLAAVLDQAVVPWDTPPAAGATVVFLPPVSGG